MTHSCTHHSDDCLCNRCHEEPRDLKAAVEKLRGELVAAKSLLEQREAEYCQARVDLAACERKLASAENAATYWEEKAKEFRSAKPSLCQCSECRDIRAGA